MTMGNAENGSRRTVGARTGGRSERVVRDVLRATALELSRAGYGPLRVEDVAARAGVNKTTIYRRWPTKADLVVAAMRASSGHQPIPDTGSARQDLVELLERWMAFARTTEGRAITRLIGAEHGDPEVDRVCRSIREELFTVRSKVLARAQERGELPPGIDARLVLDAIFFPVVTRVLRYDEEVTSETAGALVDLVLAGAQRS